VTLHDLDPDALYHLAGAAEWDHYQDQGAIAPASLDDEGFVHCSWGRQVAGTVAKHFAGVTGLLALCLDADRFGGVRLVEEDSYGSGQAFPHAYGPIPVEAVIGTVPVS
jgi:uncharacterized protein (DUF952 family)